VSAVEVAQALWLLVAALGLALSVSYAGLPILGQGAFVAVGGFGAALLGPGGAGLPLGLACLLAVGAAGTLGHLVALGAARLEGAYLALATWALAWLVHRSLLAFPDVSGGAQGLVRPAPARLVSPALGLELVLTPLTHVVLAGVLCALVLAALVRLDRGPGGLDLAALREGPALAASLGVPVAARRRAVLTATATLGGLSGAGTAVLLGLVAPADVSPLLSLQLFVAVLLGGTARWWGPVLGVAVLAALPPVADALAGGAGVAPERARGVLTAALLVAVLAARGPLRRRLRRPVADPPPRAAAPLLPARGGPRSPWRPVLLRACDVRASYGALRVLDGVCLTLRGGQVHALVGPNGSGKSTLLKVLAGELEPDAGSVEIGGRLQPARSSPERRVRSGVARTPQGTVVPALSPARQVAVAARGGNPARLAVARDLLATPSSRAAALTRARVADTALRLTALTDVGECDPAALTVGEQRLLQVARAVATGAGVLLLDEPAAGMTAGERERLRAVLRVLAGNGLAVLLVEHDMALVGAVADRVTVLAAGRVLATGRPDAVRADPAVRAAYLGSACVGAAHGGGGAA
jgi:branched-chain amino acid transport system permease protein